MLEPHIVLAWNNPVPCSDTGFGAGFHAAIPFLDNGPVPTINNNMGIGFGIDYVLSLYGPTGTIVQQATPATCASGGACYTQAGTTSLSFGTDTMTTTIPLSMLGSAAGRLNYRVFASVPQPAPTPTITTDVMPDITLPPAHVP